MANGYFKIVQDGPEFGMLIKAPTEGGDPVNLAEISEYLMQHNQTCDLTTLKNAVGQTKEDVVIRLGTGNCPAENMSYRLSIDEDLMRATVRFYPPSDTGARLTFKDFVSDLQFRQIRFGIKEERIRKVLESDDFCTDIVVAEGKPVRHGTDAHIEYYFNTDPKARPTLQEDGSVDFFNLNTVNHCKEGDVLAKLIPADPGDYGINIQGANVRPRDVKTTKLKFGHNIEISEDKLTLTSLVNGHVTLVEGKVFVSNVLSLENVDIATGNVDYEGSVEVSGNVQSNFSVKAKGNIIVNGLVEGAYLEAGGDIIIARGMAGMQKGELKAGGSIVAKFLESTTAIAGTYVSSGSILHSNVLAGEEITVDGKKGFIAGGRVCAAKAVNVKTLGSNMGTTTIIEVGADPSTKEKLQNLQKEVAEMNRVLKSLEPIITSYAQKRKQGVQFTPDQIKYLTDILKLQKQKQEELEQANSELEVLQQAVEQQSNSQVVVRGEVYPGVKIVIGDVSMAVQSSMKFCRFVKQRGDVKMVGM